MSLLSHRTSVVFDFLHLPLALALLATVFAVQVCSAQTLPPAVGAPSDTMQLPQPGSGHDYIHNLSETINPSNGTLSIRISFPVPAGRGITVPYTMQYNSGEVSTLVMNSVESALHWTSVGFPSLGQPAGNGWGTASPPPLSGTGTEWNAVAPNGCPPNQPGCANYPYNCNVASGFAFTDMNGGTHTLPISAEVPNQNANPTACPPGGVSNPAGDTVFTGVLASNTLQSLAGMQTLSVSVIDNSGNTYNYPIQAGTAPENYLSGMQDRNGNFLGAANTDTAGRTMPDFSSTGIYGVPYTLANTTATVSYQPALTLVKEDLGGDVLACPNADSIASNAASLTVPSTLNLPNGQSYQFFYNDPYGLISEIIYPNGGWVKYTWALSASNTYQGSFPGLDINTGNSISSACTWAYPTPVITDRQVSFDGSSIAETQHFSYVIPWSNGNSGSWSTKTTSVTTTDNVLSAAKGSTYTSLTAYTYSEAGSVDVPYSNSCNACIGAVESNIKYYDWQNIGTPTEIITKGWYVNATTPNQLACEFHTTGGQSEGHFYQYVYGQMSDDKEYGYGQIANPASICIAQNPVAPSSPLPIRETTTTFQQITSPVPPNLAFEKPATVVTRALINGALSEVAETDYGYDQFPIVTSGKPTNIINHNETFFGPSVQTGRGNVTMITKKCLSGSTGCTSDSVTTFGYDESGQLAYETDPCGNNTCPDMHGSSSHTTYFSFSDAYDGTTPGSSGNSNTYLTTITYPTVNVSLQKKYTYNWYQGTLSSATDENFGITNYAYDSLTRPLEVQGPSDASNGGQRPTTSIMYQDSNASTFVQQTNSNGSNKSTTSYRDGLGHVIKTATTDPNAASGLSFVDKTYYGNGSIATVSNPYNSSASAWTNFFYDAFGRKVLQQNPDSTIQQTCYNGVPSLGQTNCNPQVVASAATWVDSQDESGNDWQRLSDSFGRLVQVFEPTGILRAPTLETDYSYDALNDLIGVLQKGNGTTDTPRIRTFSYDSLGQLLTSLNPETGTSPTAYLYDGNGNLLSKKDGRGITTSYAYDALNRLYAKNYSSGDPSACMWYDTPPTGATDSFSKGKLTMEWMAPSNSCPNPGSAVLSIPTTAYNSMVVLGHDSTGHITTETQCPYLSGCGTNYLLSYGYDLLGGLTSFNNGMPLATSSTTAPAISWNIAYNSAEQVSSVGVASQPWTAAISYPAILSQSDETNTVSALGESPYDVWGHLQAEQVGLATVATGQASLLKMNAYDPLRGRVLSKVVESETVPTIATGSFGVIAVSGMEEFTSPATATTTLTLSGSDQSVVIQVPCGQYGKMCPETNYDSGVITLTAGGVSVSGAYGLYSANVVASNVAAAVNQSSSFPLTATTSGSQIILNAKTIGANSNGMFVSASSTSYDSNYFATPSFSSTSGTLSGGGTPLYDTGSIVMTINNKATTPVTWGQGSTGSMLATQISSAINAMSAANGNFITASVDASGGSVNLASTSTGAGANYPVTVSATDTSTPQVVATFPYPSFTFASSSTVGGQAGASTYGPIYYYAVPSGGYAANGNLLAQSDSVMGDWAFQYDTLNRLVEGSPATNAPSIYVGSIGCWGYDSFGNRTLATFSGSSNCSSAQPATAVYGTNNQLTLISQTAPISANFGGFSYDGAGNMLADGTNIYRYDGEGRLCAFATSPPSGGTTYTQYLYNAEGTRVGKASIGAAGFPAAGAVCAAPGAAAGFSLTAQYLLGPGGDQVTELSGTGLWQHSNEGPDVTYDAAGVHFQISDPLGTRRMETNAAGVKDGTYQSLPFGDNLVVSGADAAGLHYTGKERDQESGLDYFGARYYGSSMGRFMSPDWSAKVEPVPYSKLDDPQSLNLYAYVGNNPLSRIDPDGHKNAPPKFERFGCSDDEFCADSQQLFASLQQENANASASQPLAQQQGGAQTPAQAAANGPYGSNVISVNGNTTTVPLYNGPNSSSEIIGTQAITNNVGSNGSGTIRIVNTNQDAAGSPTQTITMRLRNGLTQSTSVRSSDGSVNADSSTSFNAHTGAATVTTINHNTSTINIRVYDTSGGSGPVLRSNTTYNTTWVH